MIEEAIPRASMTTRGQVVARRTLAKMGEDEGALRGLSGLQLARLERALADTLDIALSSLDPPKPRR